MSPTPGVEAIAYLLSSIRPFPMAMPLLFGGSAIGHDQRIDPFTAVDATKAEQLAWPQQDFLRPVRNQRHHVPVAAGAGPLLLSNCTHLFDSLLHDIQFGSSTDHRGVQTGSHPHVHRTQFAQTATTG